MKHWLVGHFTVLGVEIQNWMLLTGFIFALWNPFFKTRK